MLDTTHVFILPANEIKIESTDGKINLLVLDGQYYKEMKAGDTIRIVKSENYAEFIRFDSSFFNRIKKRMLGR
jgi:NAD kinase